MLMALLNWSDKYSVGVLAIDNQHTGLFQLVNDLHTAMLKGEAKKLTGPLLHKLLQYTNTHFTAEEKMMSDTKYPGLAEHRKLHVALIKQVKEYAARYDKGEATVNIGLLNFLCEWLTNHIQKVDREYGPWLNEHGVH
jgi:hemerythrin-like metal-binding protein